MPVHFADGLLSLFAGFPRHFSEFARLGRRASGRSGHGIHAAPTVFRRHRMAEPARRFRAHATQGLGRWDCDHLAIGEGGPSDFHAGPYAAAAPAAKSELGRSGYMPQRHPSPRAGKEMPMYVIRVSVRLIALAVVTLLPAAAAAQPLGTFTWQQQPFLQSLDLYGHGDRAGVHARTASTMAAAPPSACPRRAWPRSPERLGQPRHLDREPGRRGAHRRHDQPGQPQRHVERRLRR